MQGCRSIAAGSLDMMLRSSVRQAYTPEEMRGLLQQTPAARVEIHPHYLFRMGVIVWKK